MLKDETLEILQTNAISFFDLFLVIIFMFMYFLCINVVHDRENVC